MMKKWIVAIRRDKWKPSAHSVVCKSHTTSADYVSDTYYGKRLNIVLSRGVNPGGGCQWAPNIWPRGPSISRPPPNN